jgi:phospholipid transport system substrate-binding protein
MRHVLRAKRASWLAACLAALVVVLVAGGPARATEPAAFMEGFGHRAIKVLSETQAGTAEREVELRRLLNDHFDVEFLSRFVLSRFWRSASDAERIEFRQVFEDYVVAAYGRRFGGFNGEKFAIVATFPQDDERTVVRSDVVRSNGDSLVVDWRVQKRAGDGAWRIIDIVVEGVSMMVTQRSEFTAVLQREGSVGALNTKLKQVISGLNAQATPSPARS